MPEIPADTFPVWLINERRVRWGWVLLPALLLGVVLLAGTLLYAGWPVLGALAGVPTTLAALVGYTRWTNTNAQVTIGPRQLSVLQTASGQRETLPFQHILLHRISTYRQPVLVLVRRDGSELRLRAGWRTPGFAAMTRLFETRYQAWQRHGGA